MNQLHSAANEVRLAISNASTGLVEREIVVELAALSGVANEHMLIVGPPGTAKSEAIRRIARNLGGQYFEYLLGRFTEPNEIFGPVNIKKLREGVVETETAGMLPEAEIAFLDEVFLGSTAILNTLLSILNERTFSRGHTRITCPLRVCVGASNRIPEDDYLAAFADRFLVHTFVSPVPDSRLEDLLVGGWSLPGTGAGPAASIQSIDILSNVARNMDLQPVRPLLAQGIRALRSAGIVLSDRRTTRLQKLVAAAAALAGRDAPTESDLWPVVFAVPTEGGQNVAREALREFLVNSENSTLPAAAEDGSMGPKARAARLVETGRKLLSSTPEKREDIGPWHLRLEAVAREIDAGFSPDLLPDTLKSLRADIVAELSPR